jgi:UDP-glucose 4-epimerase
MKIAVTGSSGFIGNRLVTALWDQGHDVVKWDNAIGRPLEDFGLQGCKYVVHLAARADVRASIENPEFYWKNNVDTTKDVQKQCYYNRVPLIYASSSTIHNWWLSPYGTTKKANEATAFPDQIALRFTTVFGEGARESMFISKLLSGKLEYATNHVRDFIHVDDVVSSILDLMSIDYRLLKNAYDIGSGHGNVVSDLAKMFNPDIPIKEGDPCESHNNVADISDILLDSRDWKPTIDVKKYLLSRLNEV